MACRLALAEFDKALGGDPCKPCKRAKSLLSVLLEPEVLREPEVLLEPEGDENRVDPDPVPDEDASF